MTKGVRPGNYTSELISGALSNIELRLLMIPVVFIIFRMFGTARYIMSLLPYCHMVLLNEHGKGRGLCITNQCWYIFSPELMALQVIV